LARALSGDRPSRTLIFSTLYRLPSAVLTSPTAKGSSPLAGTSMDVVRPRLWTETFTTTSSTALVQRVFTSPAVALSSRPPPASSMEVTSTMTTSSTPSSTRISSPTARRSSAGSSIVRRADPSGALTITLRLESLVLSSCWGWTVPQASHLTRCSRPSLTVTCSVSSPHSGQKISSCMVKPPLPKTTKR